MGFLGGSDDKKSACNAGDSGLIPQSGRSPGEENGNPLQYSYLKNSKDRGAWQTTVCKDLATIEHPARSLSVYVYPMQYLGQKEKHSLFI